MNINKTHNKNIDPVCGMTVAPEDTTPTMVHQGKHYLFCAEDCRKSFEADPDKYLPGKADKKGWFNNWLDRLAKANKKAFGESGPKCCH